MFAMWQQAAERCPSNASHASSLDFRLRTAARKLERCKASSFFPLPSSGMALIFYPCLSKNAPPEASPAK
jgi:hypothetical protein